MSVSSPDVTAIVGASCLSADAPTALQRAAGRLNRWLAVLTEVPAAILVVAEIAVLFTGVVFRYGLNRPLVWSDELASVLFLWLCMLGAVIAQRRGAHMRLRALAASLNERWRHRLEAFSTSVVALFVIEIIAPALEYTTDQAMITTPALNMPDSYRALAILVGSVLMLLVVLLQVIERTIGRELLASLAIMGVVALGLWLAEPVLSTIGNWNLLVFFGLIVPCLVISGAPIAIAFGVATLTYLGMMTDMPLSVVVSRMDEGMSTLVLLSIPLFIFLGLLIEMTGLAAVMVALLSALVGHLRGGLSYVLVGAMYLVSGISGSKAADMAAIAPVLLPEMTRRGKEPGDLIGLLSSSAAMAETIPPSIVLITVGSVTGVSIAGLFSGGLLPAALGALGLVAVIFMRSRKDDVGEVRRASGREIGKALIVALPALILPMVIRWAVVSGVATATEVSSIGIVYTVLMSLVIYRRFHWKRCGPLLVETASLSGAILIILGTATAMAWALTQSGFSAQLAAAMAGVPGGRAGFLALSIVVFAILGSVLEGIPAIVLFGPLLFPVAAAFGINQIHYAIMVVLSMSLGLFTPPLGIGFYQACAIGRVDPEKAMHACWPYMAALLIAAIIVACVPWLALPGF
ncbi:TRAP transporter large permease subunit [Telmatospirillum siberiense]|uniref:ABC transporter permease n=1 Tax=Telmatospirillum siberiense TaxID=382514 RepID=A0A2N3PPP5_9PROT|nr:TRAP transporter large permease subunit [Telmatospirillum siberiense]PKU22379.1 ABC transporter permease [Telmatospirillum siberiense]